MRAEVFNQLNLKGYDIYNSGKHDKQNLIKDICLIEKLNPNLNISIFGICEKEKTIFPFRFSSNTNHPNLIEINLLLVYDEDKNSYHYCLITDLIGLCSPLHSRYKGRRFICRRCLTVFHKENDLKEHHDWCQTNQGQVLKFPKPGEDIQQFKNLINVIPTAFLCFFDFETYTPMTQTCAQYPEITTENKTYSWMKYTNEIEHVTTCELCTYLSPCSTIRPTIKSGDMIAYSYGMQLSCLRKDYYTYPLSLQINKNEKTLLYSFIVDCRWWCMTVRDIVCVNNDMVMTDQDEAEAAQTLFCKYCGRDFDFKSCKPVNDHDHLTKEWRQV